MKVTKKEQWEPIMIELESAEELNLLGSILLFTRARAGWFREQEFAAELSRQLSREVSK